MSRLIFEGNTVERFGKNVPTPFIEKINVYADSIEPTISIFLQVSDSDSINEQIIQEIGNFTLFSSIHDSGIDLSSFQIVKDDYYNSEGVRYAKLSFTDVGPFNPIRKRFYCFISVNTDESGQPNDSLSVPHRTIEPPAAGAASYNKRQNYSSHYVYEDIYAPVTGMLITGDREVYKDAEGLTYFMTPLKTIQGTYRKDQRDIRGQTIEALETLVAGYGDAPAPQLKSLLDSLSFISQTKGDKVELITSLHELRGKFPKRTSVSLVGLLYKRISEIIQQANDALNGMERLKKSVVANNKIVDLRGLSTLTLQDWGRRSTESYNPRPDDTGECLYEKFLIERRLLDADEETAQGLVYEEGVITGPEDYVSTFGYFFFDYEKAIHKKSNISQIYEVEVLQKMFGDNFISPFFQIQKTELRKFAAGARSSTTGANEYSMSRLIRTVFEDGVAIRCRSTPQSKVKFKATDNSGAKTERAYCVPRNFDLIDSLEDYNLMAFEFQNYEAMSEKPLKRGQSYRFSIYIKDNTIELYDNLVSSYLDSLNSLREYHEAASEFCSYNNLDNRFNDFFVDKMAIKYPDSHPWEMGPKQFIMHSELLFNKFDGDYTTAFTTLENITTRIAPQSGTLSALGAFLDDMQELYDSMYSASGEINRFVGRPQASLGTSVLTTSRSLRDNDTYVATTGYDALPNIADYTREEPLPTTITRWNGAEYDFYTPAVKEFMYETFAKIVLASAKRGLNPDDWSRSTLPTATELDRIIRVASPSGEYIFETLSGGTHRISRNQRQRRKMTLMANALMTFLARMNADKQGSYTLGQRKTRIESEIDYVNSNHIDLERPDAYADIKPYQNELFQTYTPIFGNLALYYIKTQRSGLFGASSWLRTTFFGLLNTSTTGGGGVGI